MYQGDYNGRNCHDKDVEAVLGRAWAAGVEKIIITAGNLQEAKAALELARTDGGCGKCTKLEYNQLSSQFFNCSQCTCCSTQNASRARLECTQRAVGSLNLTQEALKTTFHSWKHCSRMGSAMARLWPWANVDSTTTGKPRTREEDIASVCTAVHHHAHLELIKVLQSSCFRLHFCDAKTQRTCFGRQFALAKTNQLPMFFHLRAAAADFLDIVHQHQDDFVAGVVHSFDGSMEEMHQILQNPKLSIGINGCSLKTGAFVQT
jgi:TatD DNase family protein